MFLNIFIQRINIKITPVNFLNSNKNTIENSSVNLKFIKFILHNKMFKTKQKFSSGSAFPICFFLQKQ